MIVVRNGRVIGKALKDGVYLAEPKDGKLLLLSIEIQHKSKLGFKLFPEDVDFLIRRGATF